MTKMSIMFHFYQKSSFVVRLSRQRIIIIPEIQSPRHVVEQQIILEWDMVKNKPERKGGLRTEEK